MTQWGCRSLLSVLFASGQEKRGDSHKTGWQCTAQISPRKWVSLMLKYRLQKRQKLGQYNREKKATGTYNISLILVLYSDHRMLIYLFILCSHFIVCLMYTSFYSVFLLLFIF